MLHKLLISTRAARKDKKAKDLKQAVYTGRYVLSTGREKEKLLRLWSVFSQSWKNKTKKALFEAYRILPVEKNIIVQLEKTLYPTKLLPRKWPFFRAKNRAETLYVGKNAVFEGLKKGR